MLYYYADIKWIHVAAVIATGLLFLARGAGMWIGSPIGMSAPVRYLSYTIDTVLLTAALMLAVATRQFPFEQPWLTVKVILVFVYIALGSMALKRGRTPSTRQIYFMAAIATYVLIVSVALTREPLGILAPLSPRAADSQPNRHSDRHWTRRYRATAPTLRGCHAPTTASPSSRVR